MKSGACVTVSQIQSIFQCKQENIQNAFTNSKNICYVYDVWPGIEPYCVYNKLTDAMRPSSSEKGGQFSSL